MKNITLCILGFLLISLLNSNVYAQPDTGSTVINATITGEMLSLSLWYPEITIPEDYYFYENLTVFQNYQNIYVYLNKTDSNNFMKFVNKTDGGTYYQDDYTLYLPPYTYENVTLRVYVPPDQGYEGGTYDIQIYAYSLNDSRSNTTTLEIEVNNTNPIDDIEIINIYPSSLYSGESLDVDISIHKIYPQETTDIQICYCIDESPTYLCGPSYNNYGCSWKAITEWLNYTKTVTVNEGPGNYYFIVAVKYPGDENIKRANSPTFYIRSLLPITPGPIPGAPPQPKLTIIAPNYVEASPGERINLDVEIKNIGNAKARDTSLNIYGIPENWVSITPSKQDIRARESKNYSVSIFLPITAYEQIYSLSLIAKSGSIESTKTVTMTVAMTLRNMAKFLLDEAKSKKKEAEEIIEKAKGWNMDTTEPEKTLTITDAILDEAKMLFESRDYKESIERAKQAIEGYKSVISSVKWIVEQAYLLLLDDITTELGKIENLTEEKDVIDSINHKIEQSTLLQRQERVIEAYQILLDAKQLLDQLKGKIYLMELVKNILIISMIIIIIVVISMPLFYRKEAGKLIKIMKIEEHKRRLKFLFRKEVGPGITYKERPKIYRERFDEIRRYLFRKETPTTYRERPRLYKEKLEEIRSLLKDGEALADTDINGAKDAYIKARKAYNSLSHEERKLTMDENLRLMRLHRKIVKKSS